MDNPIVFRHTAEELLMRFTIKSLPDECIGYWCDLYSKIYFCSENYYTADHFIAEDLHLWSEFSADYRDLYCTLTYVQYSLHYQYTYECGGSLWLNEKELNGDEISQIANRPLLHVFNGVEY